VPKRIRKPIIDKIIEMANLGALHDVNYTNAMAKKLKLHSIPEDQAKRIFQLASELQNTTGRNARIVKTAELKAAIEESQPVSVWRKISALQTISQLLNLKTAIRNIGGNALFNAVESVADVPAAILDLGLSKITGKRTQVLPNIGMATRSLSRGFGEGVRDAKMGIDTGAGASQYDLPRARVFQNKILNALETAMNIELKATDRAFYNMAYRESLWNQLRAAKKSGSTRTRITPEMVAVAHHEALYRTFQDDSIAATAFSGLKKLLNIGKEFGVGDQIIKFPKTPGNLLSRAFAYSPAGYVKSIYYATAPFMHGQAFNQREFVKSLSRATIGSGALMGTGAVLGSLGLATGERSGDKNLEGVKLVEGMGQYKINATGLMRYSLSFTPESAKPQKGDVWVSYDWLQPMAIPFAAGVDLSTKQTKGKPLEGTEAVGASVLRASDSLTNQGVMRGIEEFTSARNEEGQWAPAEGLINVMAGAPSSFVPTTVSQVNQLTDNTTRETYDPTLLKQSVNKVVAKIPWASKMLPEKKNVYGESQERYQDATNNVFNVMLNPAFVSKMKATPTGSEVLRIFETTGETKQAPKVVAKKLKITRGGKTEEIQLSGKQVSEYQEYVGKNSKRILDKLVRIKMFNTLDDDGKAEVMASVITDVNTAAKMQLFRHESNTRPRFITFGVAKGSQTFINGGASCANSS
jgi:hypothetical protein